MSPNKNSGNSGCGCLILLILAFAYSVNQCNKSDTSSTPIQNKPSTTYQSPKHAYSPVESVEDEHMETEEELTEEEKLYLNNSLATGATPYAAYYGKGYKCPYSQCSGIKVTAPRESDIVVIIKKNNQNGKVVQHGYICAGNSYQFDIPDGTYQTFFYYGTGWNPNKEMTGGIKGGFVKYEVFSKDNPQDIYSGVLSYVLQLQRNGNFQTMSSNKGEMF